MKYSNLNLSDQKLIDEVAAFWVAGGGDAVGIRYCLEAIIERVEDLQEQKKED